MAQEQLDDRGLARSGAADDGDLLARLQREADVLQGGRPVGGVGEREVPRLDASLDRGGARHGARVVVVGLRVKDLRQPAHAGDAALGDADHPADRDHGPEQLELVAHEGREDAEAERFADDGFAAHEERDDHRSLGED